MSGHTKGPWVAYGEQVSATPDPETRFIIANAYAPLALRSTKYTETAQANARLIAAAPDMYEALKNVRKIPRPWIGGNVTGDEWLAACDAVQAALAKAEGRT